MIAVGQPLELERDRTGERYPATAIQLVDAGAWLELHAEVTLGHGEPIRLLVTTEDGAWYVEADVLEVRDPGATGRPLLRVAFDGEPQALQRRDFFRVPASLALRFAVTASVDAARVTGLRIDAATVDLSAGGLRCETAEPLLAGDALALTLDLPARPLELTGAVTRIVPPPDRTPSRAAGPVLALVGVAFGAMMERDRAEITRFVHDVERKLRAVVSP